MNQTRQVYEKAPFPNSNIKSIEIIKSVGKNYCKGLGFEPKELRGKKVLIAGCGTGEHAVGIAIAFKPREVIGLDLSDNSISNAKQYKKRFNLNNLEFIQGDIFDLPFKKESFDLVICEGVLHHTENPEKGMEHLADITKKNGIIIIGIYSATGRLKQRIKRAIIDFTIKEKSQTEQMIKKLFGEKLSKEKLFDDYFNPIISHHFIHDSINWLEKNDFKYIGSYYPFEVKNTFESVLAKIQKKECAKKENAKENPNFLDQVIIQFVWLLTNQTMIRFAGIKRNGDIIRHKEFGKNLDLFIGSFMVLIAAITLLGGLFEKAFNFKVFLLGTALITGVQSIRLIISGSSWE